MNVGAEHDPRSGPDGRRPVSPEPGSSSGRPDEAPGPSSAGPANGAPAELPDFELLAEIGRGGFGSVWIAKHRHTGDAVAIKFIPPRSRDTELKGLQLLRQRVREGQSHLVWTEYIGEAGEYIYCVMDLADNVVEGPLFPDRYEAMTLFKYLRQRGRLDLADAQTVILSMAKGLAFLQEVGLRHGDVKPANVLRVRGRWKLADYGMMGGLDVRARGGTRSYAPPEGPHGERADQFALGIVLHELVFGKKPAEGSEAWPASRLGTGLRRICERMLENDASRRFASMNEAVEALEALSTGRSSSAAGTSACPHCGESVDDDQAVCGGCGGELWQTCPACEGRGSILQRFCTTCRAPVHAIRALDQELTEAEDLLGEGRHREVLSRAEGPLADLCNEVSHQLGKMQGGDLARTRRGSELRERFEFRRRGLIEKANTLKQVDEAIAAAHAAGHVTELRAAVESGLQVQPGSPNYLRLRAELPRLESQARWNALLIELGSPQKDPRRVSGRELRRAVRAIQTRMPDDPDVRIEAKRLVNRLIAEQTRRLRVSYRKRADRNREAGRPLEALEWLRRAEASGSADESVRATIEELVAELRLSRLPGLLESLADDQIESSSHRVMRRAVREVEAITPDEPRLVGWKSAWARRRRIGLLGRIRDRCIVAIAREHATESQMLVSLAYRVAGRDARLAESVLELDNAVEARWNALRSAMTEAAEAEVSGDVLRARDKWRDAASIASESDRIVRRLEQAEAAAAERPRVRRRRWAIGSVAVLLLFGVVAALSLQYLSWRRADQALSGISNVSDEIATDRLAAIFEELERRDRFPFGDWGMSRRAEDVWQAEIERRAGQALSSEIGGAVPGRLTSVYAALGAEQRAWLAERLTGIAIESLALDVGPDRVRVVDHLLTQSELFDSGLQVPEIEAAVQKPLGRIASGERIVDLRRWWSLGESDFKPPVSGPLRALVIESFTARRELETIEMERTLRSYENGLSDLLRTGEIANRGRFDDTSTVRSFELDVWSTPDQQAMARSIDIARESVDNLRMGRIDVEIAEGVLLECRLVAMEGAGVLVGTRLGVERLPFGRGSEGLDIRRLLDEVSSLRVGLGGLTWRCEIPDVETWSVLDGLLQERFDRGMHPAGEELSDLAVNQELGEDPRGYAMPGRFPVLLIGADDVGVRLVFRSE